MPLPASDIPSRIMNGRYFSITALPQESTKNHKKQLTPDQLPAKALETEI
jgi:hypothetical protein